MSTNAHSINGQGSAKDNAYIIETDGKDGQKRLNAQHTVMQSVLDNKYLIAPLKSEPKLLLELGTGTGVWATEYARAHPDCKVIAVDIVKTIAENPPPSNFEFRILDITKDDWGFTEKFDVIHSRLLSTIQLDWAKLLSNIFNNLKPGGYVEMKEGVLPPRCDDGSWEANGARSKHFYDMWKESLKTLGVDWFLMPKIPAVMKGAGFVDVGDMTTELRAGPWGKSDKDKENGVLWATAQYNHPLVFTAPLMKGLGWSEEKALAAIQEIYDEAMQGKVHVYVPFVITWGRKPE